MAAQSLHQRHGRRQREAHHVDHDVGIQRDDPVAERSLGLGGVTVDANLLHLAPGLVDDVGLALPAAEVDDLMPGPDQPRNEEAADMPAAADHHDAHDCRA